MPGFVMHLSEAKIVGKKWKKIFEEDKNLDQDFDYIEWERKFLYGSLLPDSVQFPGGKDPKAKSHLWTYSRAEHVFMVPDLYGFIDRYKEALKDPVHHPVLIGYLAHLHLDYAYFRNFLPSMVTLEDKDGNHTNKRAEIRQVYIRKNGKRIPLPHLFSNAYLYGDYMRLNPMMIDLYDVKAPEYDPQILIDEPIPEVAEGNMDQLLLEMEKYLSRSKFNTRELQIFREGVTIPFLNDCAEAFFTVWENLK